MKCLFTDKQLERVKYLYIEEEWSCRKIAKHFKVCDGRIYNYLKRMGVEFRDCNTELNKYYTKHLPLKKYQRAKKLYLEGESIVKLGEDFNINRTTFTKWLRSEGVQIRNFKEVIALKSILDRKNVDFFDDINTEEKAYWLGFIYADGSIDGKYRLSIGLKRSDKQHLEKFASIFNVNVNDRVSKTKGKTFKGCACGVSSRYIVSALKDKGIYHRKSYNGKGSRKILTSIPNELMNHFLRGYLDGDGSLGITEGGRFRINFSGRKTFLQGVRKIIINKLNVTKNEIYDFKNNFSHLNWTGNDALIVAKYLYKKANIYLDRKYEIYKPFRKRKLLEPKSGENYKIKLTEKKVLNIRKRYSTGAYTQKELAVIYGVTRETLSSIINKRTWKHI